MSGKRLTILAVFAILLAGLAMWTSREADDMDSSAAGSKLLPDLGVNSIDRIELESGGDRVVIAKGEKGWVMPATFNYPANFTRVRDLILALEDISIGQIIGANDAQKRDISLTPELATRLRLIGDGETLAELLLGDMRQNKASSPQMAAYSGMPDGRYVSVDNGETVCLTADILREAVTTPNAWMDQEIAHVAESGIDTISVTPKGGPSLLWTRRDDELTLADLAESEELDESKAYAVKSALSHLRFNDIADPALSDNELGLTAPSTFAVTTKDGTTYTVHIGSSPENSTDRYARLAVTFTAPPPEKTEDAEDDAATQTEADAAGERAARLHAKVSPWTFRIADHKAEAMETARDLLIKQPDPPEGETSDEPTHSPQGVDTVVTNEENQ